MYTTKDARNHITQENLNSIATRALEEKRIKRENKKRALMAGPRRKCERAARKGKMSMSFRAGYGTFYKYSPSDFKNYFSMDRDFTIKADRKGWVTVSWREKNTEY